jgi:large subunit ribosomal protein L21
MYAIIFSGGKQYRVEEGDILKLETLSKDIGSTIDFEKVLMVGKGEKCQLGKPFVENCKVTATILSHGRHDKIKIVKFRRRKHHEKWQGHRQNYTEVKITHIKA